MAEHLEGDHRRMPARAGIGRRERATRTRDELATILRRSAQCLRIAPREVSEGGAPTHRVIFTYPDGEEMPEAASKMSRAFGLGLALVLSLRSERHLCRVFAVAGAHAQGVTSLHFTVSLRAFAIESVKWRRRPSVARARRGMPPIGATLPLPL